MPTPEQDSALIAQAAIEVGRDRGLQNLPVALSEPLPEGRRQYLYTVSDQHPLQEVYGATALSAILITTQTPHLADRNTKTPLGGSGQKPARYGLRYCDRQNALDPLLEPFVSEEAKRAWRNESEERRREQHAVVQAATSTIPYKDAQAAVTVLPEPKNDVQDLQDKSSGVISTGRLGPSLRNSTKDNSR